MGTADLKNPEGWELWYIPDYGHTAGFISSTLNPKP